MTQQLTQPVQEYHCKLFLGKSTRFICVVVLLEREATIAFELCMKRGKQMLFGSWSKSFVLARMSATARNWKT
jgi:hypothetical protein